MNVDISVVMPVYNCEEFVGEAIESILQQSFTNFECIIVDDASTDGTPEILARYARIDQRVIILTNEENKRIAASLNMGIQAARAPYIARMDGDDWAYPDRLEKQLRFMQSHPEVTVCGGAVQFYETAQDVFLIQSYDAIKAFLLFDSPIPHPTVMMKKETVLSAGGYSLECPAEDYDLWARLSLLPDVVMMNMPDTVLRYRTHPAAKRHAYAQKLFDAGEATRTTLLTTLFPDLSQDMLQMHVAIAGRHFEATDVFYKGVLKNFGKLQHQCTRTGYCSSDSILHVMAHFWHNYFAFLIRHNILLAFRALAHPLFWKLPFSDSGNVVSRILQKFKHLLCQARG